jgi:tetratricopeptide (TPR) repeat protein
MSSVLAEDPRTLAGSAAQLWEYLKLYAGEYTLWLCWLPALGAWVLWSRARWAFSLLLAVFLVAGPGMALLLNFTIDRQSLWLNNVFWIPSYLAASVFLGLALEWIALRAPQPGVQRAVLALALVLCTGVPLVSHYARNTKRHYHYAEDFGRNLLASLPENAIYFPTADHATFPVLYLQVAEGLRPDVTLANKYGYPERSVFKDMPQDFLNSLPGVPNKGQEQYIEDWVIQNSGLPVYFTRKRTLEGLPDYQLVQAGLTFAVLPKSAAPPARDYWAEYTWRSLDLDATQGELSATYILSDYYYMRGREALERGELDAAKEALDLAATAGGDSKELLNNIASAYAEANVLDAAEDFYKRTLAVDPAYTTARKNLAKTYLQRGRAEEAILELEEALRQEAKDPEALRLSAKALVEIGWKDEAIQRYEYLAELQPGDAEVSRELGYLYLNHRKDAHAAQQWLTRSLRANPDQPGIADLLASLATDATAPGIPEAPKPEMPELPDGSAAMPPTIPMPDFGLLEIPGLPAVP